MTTVTNDPEGVGIEPQHVAQSKPETDTVSSTPSTRESIGGQSTPPSEITQPPLQDGPAAPGSNQKPTSATNAAQGMSTPILRVPFEHPPPQCKPVSRPALTPEQELKYEAVITTVSSWSILPTSSARNASTEPLHEHERMFLTRECILRYLRATNWSAQAASQRLQATIVWRREFGAEKITADLVSEENETGKQVILGYDNDARPCLYLDPARQNTKKSERQIQHLVYMLDRVIEMMDPGQETTALLINFKNSSAGGNPSVGQGRQVLNILQGHYPERLGKALISDLPWYVTTFFKLISPFIDPVTKSKMIFNQPLRGTYVPAEQLWKNYGGDANFEYDHGVYWPALTELCTKRREQYVERWVKGGKRIGEYEEYLRGGDKKSLSGTEEEKMANEDN